MLTEKRTEIYKEYRYSGVLFSNLGNVKKHDGSPIGINMISGYKSVSIRSSHTYVHHAVAECFHGMRSPYYEVNHKDCDKLNNHVDNLEYVTHLENMRHAQSNGLITTPKRGIPKRLTQFERDEITAIHGMYGFKIIDAAKEYGVDVVTIRRILKGTPRSPQVTTQRERDRKRIHAPLRTLANNLVLR